ncbi:MAG: hypothetical protein IJD07_00440 [Clostridia bacterium]|nr:hypothetical protein [Clostridia bacterium]
MTTMLSSITNLQFALITAGGAVVLLFLCMITFSSTKKNAQKRAEQVVAQMREEWEKRQAIDKDKKLETENEQSAVLDDIKQAEVATETDEEESKQQIVTAKEQHITDESDNNENLSGIFDEPLDLDDDTKSVEAEIIEPETDDGIVFERQEFSSDSKSDDAEKQALKKQIKDLKNDVENLKFELNQRGPSRGVSATGYNMDLGDLERELYKAQQQYSYMGEKLLSITDENERLDLYLERITLLEKIMKLGSGIERLKNVAYTAEQARSARNAQVKKTTQAEGNRAVYSKIMEQVRRLNDRMDEIEKRRGKREREDFSSK